MKRQYPEQQISESDFDRHMLPTHHYKTSSKCKPSIGNAPSCCSSKNKTQASASENNKENNVNPRGADHE